MIVDPSRRAFLGFIATLILVASPALLAQSEQNSTNYLLTISTERPDATYGKGEVVSFQIKLLLDQKAFDDTTCPPTSVYAAYNALKGRKEIFNDPPSTHTVSPKAGQAMRDAILQHVEAVKTEK